jgi:uncharacterized protein (TIGR04551 family)
MNRAASLILAATAGAAAAAVSPQAACAADEWGLGAMRDPFVAEDPALDPGLSLGGYFRMRGDVFDNLDLNRGPTPTTGETVFPVPLTDAAQNDTLTSSNLRLRLEPHIRVGWEVNVHAVIDCLDNVVLGSTPATSNRWAGMSAAATSQQAPADSIRVGRVWAEIGTPIGLLTAGRMGVQWGLGVLANSGDCLDCDQGNVVDTIGLALPVGQEIVGLAYDVASSGPAFSPWGGIGQSIDADPDDDVRSLSLAIMRADTPAVRAIKLRDGRHVLNYGLVASYRWQNVDFPVVPADGSMPTVAQAVRRDLSGVLIDAHVSWQMPHNHLEFEAAVLRARMEDGSLVPGLSTAPLTALQWGGVLRDTFEAIEKLTFKAEVGLASGDPAPGFGARPGAERDKARAGDLDAPQIALPDDTEIGNFRFHPDYHVDLILFREIVGTVTDAMYFKPTVAYGPVMGLTFEASAIYSRAMEAASTPGGDASLGLETDLAVRYRSHDRFVLALEYGVLFPGAGFDNVAPAHAATATTAQRLHGTLGVLF